MSAPSTAPPEPGGANEQRSLNHTWSLIKPAPPTAFVMPGRWVSIVITPLVSGSDAPGWITQSGLLRTQYRRAATVSGVRSAAGTDELRPSRRRLAFSRFHRDLLPERLRFYFRARSLPEAHHAPPLALTFPVAGPPLNKRTRWHAGSVASRRQGGIRPLRWLVNGQLLAAGFLATRGVLAARWRGVGADYCARSVGPDRQR